MERINSVVMDTEGLHVCMTVCIGTCWLDKSLKLATLMWLNRLFTKAFREFRWRCALDKLLATSDLGPQCARRCSPGFHQFILHARLYVHLVVCIIIMTLVVHISRSGPLNTFMSLRNEGSSKQSSTRRLLSVRLLCSSNDGSFSDESSFQRSHRLAAF